MRIFVIACNRIFFSSYLLCLLYAGSAIGWTWEQCGQQGGYFKDFVVHPSNPQVIYAGSDDSGGLWKTTDGGQSWELMTDEWPDMTAWQIVLDPFNPDIIYICDPYGRYGLLKSLNGGQSWQQITTGLSSIASRMVSDLLIASENGDSLYISTGLDREGNPPKPGNGIYVSADGGENWEPSGLQGETALCICRCSDGTLLAGLEGQGLFRSINGSTWSQVSSVPADASVWQLDSHDNVVVAAVNPYGIYLSWDYGLSFEFSLNSVYTPEVSIARTSPETEIYACIFPGFVKYTSTSGEWTDVTSPPLPYTLMLMGLSTSGDSLFCGAFANSPIFFSEDGAQNWTVLPSSPTASYLCCLAVDPNAPERICAANLGSYMPFINMPCLSRTTDGGQNWERMGPDAHGLFVHYSPGSSDTMYCGTFRNGAFRSNDGFSSWTAIRQGDKIVFDLIVDETDPSIILLAEWDLEFSTYGIYRSSDGGGSFQQVLQIMCTRFLQVPQCGTFYAATTEGLYVSTDQGQTWSYVDLSAYSLMSLEWYEGDVYTGTETGNIFRIYPTYTQEISGGWDKPVWVSDLLFIEDTLYAGFNGAEVDTTFVMHGGVWRTPDLGSTWEMLTGDLSVTHVYGNSPMALSGSELLVSTYGGGVFRLEDLQGVENPWNTPQLVIDRLSVRPNPSSDGFSLEVELSVSSSLRVTVYNLAGRVMRKLPEFEAPAGMSSLFWNGLDDCGRRVPDGVYLCSVSGSGGVHRYCRAILIKR
ncbi:MAG: hypothetical protein KAW14_11290 [Candidatus Aegiribacteria sp.]|nr:hypothetical protein [Candidatus Aegiribacteria sp.]